MVNQPLRLSLRLPWPAGMRLLCTAGYGPTAGSPYHSDDKNAYYAIDFDKPWQGDRMPVVPIIAVTFGKVEIVGSNQEHDFGYHLIIDHGKGYRTLYAHLRNQPVVRVREAVQQGQILGYLGETGNAQGPHLHFQVFYYGHCRKDVWQSCPEPISGYSHIRVGQWYQSNNQIWGDEK